MHNASDFGYSIQGQLPKPETRAIWAIAREISANWPKPYFGAVPYLKAMHALDSIGENFYEDSGVSVVSCFLANANTWKGDVARRLKAELNAIVKAHRSAR
jgi:hypothetical protein